MIVKGLVFIKDKNRTWNIVRAMARVSGSIHSESPNRVNLFRGSIQFGNFL